MEGKLERGKGENYYRYIKRISSLYRDKIITPQDWASAILGEECRNMYSDEYIRRAFTFFVKFLENNEEDAIENIEDEHLVQELKQAKEELIKERKKLQTVNAEAQDFYRTVGRNELFNEKIQEAISKLEPVQTKDVKYTYPIESTGLLVLADQHYDSNFEVKGLFGETINAYSKDIFKERMWYLLGQMTTDRFDYDKLLIVSCGDALEGLLRMTSLQKLKGNVIDDAIEFANFMAIWLVEAQKRLGIPITFQLISGNHDVVRSLTQKPEFPEETLAKVIHEFIRLRLADSKNITVEPYSDVYYTTLHGSNLMFAHEVNTDLIDYYENLYDVEIDTLYGAHLHRMDVKPMGVAKVGDREMIRVPSIVGTDPYARKIQKHSRAGAYFALYSDNGKELNKVYYLN